MPTIELAPEHGAAKALVRVIDRRAKDITHRVLKRRESGANWKGPYAKTQLRRDLNVLVGMVQAYGVICGIPIPQDTLYNYDNARRLVDELR